MKEGYKQKDKTRYGNIIIFDDLPIIVKCQLTQVGFKWFMSTELILIDSSSVVNLLKGSQAMYDH